MKNKLAGDFSDLLQFAKANFLNFLEEASETDSPDLFPLKTIQSLKEANFLSACVSSDFGGKNLGIKNGTNHSLLTILKLIGAGNLVVGRIIEGHINAQLLINQYGNFEQKRKFAEDALTGKLFGVWNTQGEDGVFLKFKNGLPYLNGSKTFATGADYVSRPLVTATLENGSTQMCIVPFDEIYNETDSKWWNPMGMKATRSYKVTFKNSPIPIDNLLGEVEKYHEQPTFTSGSMRFSAVQLGAAETLLRLTLDYLHELKRTENPFQKMRIGEMTVLITSGNLWLDSAAEYLDRYMSVSSTHNAKLLLHQSNMVRTAIDEICIKAIALCQKCVGARGLNIPYHFERIIRDLNMYLRQPAPDHALAEVGRFSFEQEWDESLE